VSFRYYAYLEAKRLFLSCETAFTMHGFSCCEWIHLVQISCISSWVALLNLIFMFFFLSVYFSWKFKLEVAFQRSSRSFCWYLNWLSWHGICANTLQSTAKSSDSQSQSRWTRWKSIYGKRDASLGTFGPPKINLMLLPFFLSNGAPLAWTFGTFDFVWKIFKYTHIYHLKVFLLYLE